MAQPLISNYRKGRRKEKKMLALILLEISES